MLALGCAPDPGPPPYGFASQPEQSLRFEAEGVTHVDGQRVEIQRYADIRLVLEHSEDDRNEIVVYLERYYVRVVGAPGGTTEFAISERGMTTRTEETGRVTLAPDRLRPGGGRVSDLRERPLGGGFVDARGAAQGDPWRSQDAVLAGIPLLDWILLALPVLDAEGSERWQGQRRVPALGQYELGIQLPLRYVRQPANGGGGTRIRASGLIRRESLEVAPGLEGALSLDCLTEVELGAQGALQEAQVELRMRFESHSGTVVSSQEHVHIRRREAGEGLREMPGVPDILDE